MKKPSLTRSLLPALALAPGLTPTAPALAGPLHTVTRPEFRGAAAPSFPEKSLGSAAVEAPGFDIQLSFVNAPSDAERAAFASAERTWESLLVGYQVEDLANQRLDVSVTLEAIDGVFNVLGSAGPTSAKLNRAQNNISRDFVYAQSGSMRFDTADTAYLIERDLFDDVVLHEMGHVLGIGTLWQPANFGTAFSGRQDLSTDGTGSYTGEAGVAAYNRLFGFDGGSVPVELDGGEGTANGHWNEVADYFGDDENQVGFDADPGDGGPAPRVVDPGSEFLGLSLDDELMTGRLSGTAFLSDLTLGGLVDLGYVVVPEPATAGLMLAGGLMLLPARRRA